mmetsp:Transcript_14875/g.30599  ORF Transcript_14875/g.30599 Transcript_14875/m.30599 type:complete len:526 (+) Transcript_14875:72-1649(+)
MDNLPKPPLHPSKSNYGSTSGSTSPGAASIYNPLLKVTQARDTFVTPTKIPPVSNSKMNHSKRLALNLVLLLGSANVVPWSAYISVSDYWNTTFPDKQLNFVFPVLNMSLLAVGTVLTTLGGRNIGSLRSRIQGTNLLITLLLLCVPLIIMPNAKSSWALPALYANLCLLSLLVSVNQSSCYGLAGVMGPEFIQALERGKGWTGVAVVVLRGGIKYAGGASKLGGDKGIGEGESETSGTGTFFLSASLIVFLATVGYGWLVSGELARARVDEYEGNLQVHEATPRNTPSNTPNTTPTTGRKKAKKKRLTHHGSATTAVELTRKVKNKIIVRIQVPLVTVFLVFTLCISCFPGVATALHSDTWNIGSWFPLAMVAAYNTADLVGKTLPSYMPLAWKGNRVWVTAIPLAFAAVLMVLEMLEDYGLFGSVGFPLLQSDTLKVLSSFLLGLFTGYSSTSCMMSAPGMVDRRYRDIATQLMATSLIFGLLAGSLGGVAIKEAAGLGDVQVAEVPPYPIIHWSHGHDGHGP